MGVVLALGLSAAEPTAPKFHQHDNKAAVNLAAQIDAQVKALKLPPEKDVEFLSNLGKAFDSQPISKVIVETERGGNKVRLAIHERGTGTNDSLVIFIHGLLADSGTWRYMVGAGANGYDAWFIDLPGYGDSDKPNPAHIEPDGYSPTAIGERILQAIQRTLDARIKSGAAPKRITVIGHSLGGSITLRMFGDAQLKARYASVIDRVQGIMLIDACDFAVNTELPIFMQVVNLSTWKAMVGNFLGVVQSKTTQATRESYHQPMRATEEIAKVLCRSLTHPASLHATQAMIRQAIPWHVKEHRPDWQGIRRMVDDYSNITVPCLILWGEWDEALTVAMGYKLKDEISGARLVKLEGCGHSPHWERPTECAQLLANFDRLVAMGKWSSPDAMRNVSRIELANSEAPKGASENKPTLASSEQILIESVE